MLERLSDDWWRYDGGRRWRCRSPHYFCETDDAGHIPSVLAAPGISEKIRRIRAFYAGRLSMGALDKDGTALDILIANAMTESYGTVPSPLNLSDLEKTLDQHPELPLDVRLDTLLRQIGAAQSTRWLVRREPGYTAPIASPSRVSVGAHHMLISTALALPTQRRQGVSPPMAVREQVLKLASQSLHAGQLALEYLNQQTGRHLGQLPLIAATYNAGSPRRSSTNPWHLVQYGEHIDRWISYYNASRQAIGAQMTQVASMPTTPPPPAPLLPARATIPIGPQGQLSPHFTLLQLISSDKARELHINNQPLPGIIENLKRLAAMLEQIRSLLGERAIIVNSAYRCPELNQAVGSKPTSMHMQGLAADIICPTFGSPLHICQAIAASPLPFDQVIHEFGRWVHIGLALGGKPPRRQQLTIDKHGTHVGLLAA